MGRPPSSDVVDQARLCAGRHQSAWITFDVGLVIDGHAGGIAASRFGAWCIDLSTVTWNLPGGCAGGEGARRSMLLTI